MCCVVENMQSSSTYSGVCPILTVDFVQHMPTWTARGPRRRTDNGVLVPGITNRTVRVFGGMGYVGGKYVAEGLRDW